MVPTLLLVTVYFFNFKPNFNSTLQVPPVKKCNSKHKGHKTILMMLSVPCTDCSPSLDSAAMKVLADKDKDN